MSSPGHRVAVGESVTLNRDLGKFHSIWGEIKCQSDKDYDSLQVTLNTLPFTTLPMGGIVAKKPDYLIYWNSHLIP